MKKLLFLLLFPSLAFADRLGSLRSDADVLLTTQTVASSGGSSSLEVMTNSVRTSSPTATLSLIAGSNITLTGALVGGTTAQVTITGTGGGSPAGGATELQARNGSSFAAVVGSSSTATGPTISSGSFVSALNIPFAKNSAFPNSYNALLYASPTTGAIASYAGLVPMQNLGSNTGLAIFDVTNGDLKEGLDVTIASNLGSPNPQYGAKLSVTGGNSTNYGLYVDASAGTNAYALYANSGLVNIQGLTASQMVRTDASKNLVSSASLTTTELVGVLQDAQLANVTTANQYGSATVVPVITYDAKGRVTAVSSATISASSGGGVVVPSTFTWSGVTASDISISSTLPTGFFTSGGLLVNNPNFGAGQWYSPIIFQSNGSNLFAMGYESQSGGVGGGYFWGDTFGGGVYARLDASLTANRFVRTGPNKDLISSATVTTSDLVGVLNDAQLANVVTANQFGSTTIIPVITFDAKGRITAVSSATAAGGGGITALTGDVTASGSGSVPATLASVTTANQFGSASVVPVVTFDAKGRITAVSSATLPTVYYSTYTIQFKCPALDKLETNFAVNTATNTGTSNYLTCSFDNATRQYVNGFFMVPYNLNSSGNITIRTMGRSSTAASSKNVAWVFEHQALANGSQNTTAYLTSMSGALAVSAVQGVNDTLSWSVPVSSFSWTANNVVNFRFSRDIGPTNNLTAPYYDNILAIEMPVTISLVP